MTNTGWIIITLLIGGLGIFGITQLVNAYNDEKKKKLIKYEAENIQNANNIALMIAQGQFARQ